jgi:hypothetical protein
MILDEKKHPKVLVPTWSITLSDLMVMGSLTSSEIILINLHHYESRTSLKDLSILALRSSLLLK